MLILSSERRGGGGGGGGGGELQLCNIPLLIGLYNMFAGTQRDSNTPSCG